MISPLLKDHELLADIREASKSERGVSLWWLGQSGFLVQWEGRHILIDPYLSDSLTDKYADTDKPHTRMTELVVKPQKLDFIDLVTSSHNHTDHLDGETLIPLIRVNPNIRMVVPRANREFAADRLARPKDWFIGLNAGESIEPIPGIRVHGIPSAHNELERDSSGHCRFMGYIFQTGKYTLYHSGDTLWHEDILEALSAFQIDLALLPINGNVPERRVAGNLNAMEAVNLSKHLNVNILIPCHYHMFSFNTVDPDEICHIARKQGQKLKVLRCGERFHYM